ncbi:MAG: UDP-glucose 4-epimerase [Planctomycetaceae bacterium]|nr:UDP-glucose 4-epimerase [Planctomycetaceae bacterium]
MSILVTGNAGLIGARFCDWLIENTNHQVIGIDDLSGGYRENIKPEIIFINKSLLEDLTGIFDEYKPQVIYHFAAYAAEGLSPFIRKYNYENNLIASVNLINNAIKFGVKRFVFTSSMAVYGEVNNPPFSESDPTVPIDPYGIAKLAVEQDLKVAKDQHDLNYTIIRPHNFYGSKQNIWDRYRNVLGIWMNQIINGQQPTIFGTGEQRRAFSCIDDALIPLWNASQRESCIGEIINLGGAEDTSILDACLTLLEVTGSNLEPIFLQSRHEAKNAFSTWQKSVDFLDFEHKTTLKNGLSMMWEWAKEQPTRPQFTWDKYELDKQLYDYWK